MVKYTIYEISCKDENIKSIYVGHTKTFFNRMENHKNPFNNNIRSPVYNYPLYKIVRENGGWNNWIINKLEIIQGDRDKAAEREQYWMDLKQTDMNQVNAYDKNEIRRLKNKQNNNKRKIKKRNELIKRICNIYNKDVNEVINYIENKKDID